MSRNPLLARPRVVERLEDCYFYHTMELPGLGVRRGHWDLRGKFYDYVGGVDVAGRSVLDVGRPPASSASRPRRRARAASSPST